MFLGIDIISFSLSVITENAIHSYNDLCKHCIYDEHVFNFWIKSNLAIFGGGGGGGGLKYKIRWCNQHAEKNTHKKYIMYEWIIHDII